MNGQALDWLRNVSGCNTALNLWPVSCIYAYVLSNYWKRTTITICHNLFLSRGICGLMPTYWACLLILFWKRSIVYTLVNTKLKKHYGKEVEKPIARSVPFVG